MPVSRLIVAVLAFALLGLVPTTSQASAAKPPAARPAASALAPTSAPTSAAVSTRAAARVTKLTIKIVRRNGKLFLTGVIRPKTGPVIIQKANSCNRRTGTCNFRRFTTTKVNDRGRYTARVFAPRVGAWAWRSKKDRRVSEVWLTCIKKRGEDCPIP